MRALCRCIKHAGQPRIMWREVNGVRWGSTWELGRVPGCVGRALAGSPVTSSTAVRLQPGSEEPGCGKHLVLRHTRYSCALLTHMAHPPGGTSTAMRWSLHSEERRGSATAAASLGVLTNSITRAGAASCVE